MQRSELEEIIACLPRGKTLYQYFPDRQALWLLARAAGNGARIADLRRGEQAGLLGRPGVRAIIAAKGDGILTAADLDAAWPRRWQTYRLTLGRWGSDSRRDAAYLQTSRPGWNLVLQMNFSKEHDAPFRRYVRDHRDRPFEFGGHPIAGRRGRTLAWARLDVDLATGEALIEEVQNDWLRFAEWRRQELLAERREGAIDDPRVHKDTMTYFDRVLAPHRKHWDKAILLAVLMFLVEELGIRRIWMHEAECGARLKQILGVAPPRSLYTTLPRSFGFARTKAPPEFLDAAHRPLLRRGAREGWLRFWRLDF